MKPLLVPLVPVLAILTGCSTSERTSGGGQSGFAMLGTNRVHYLTVGKGPPTIVFVHGWACNGGFWREQIPALAGKARLILIDLPGHGRSDVPHIRYTMDYMASGVSAVMEDAGVNKAILVGHSMGVPVICRAYAQDTGKVAGLVAVDGVLYRPDLPPEQREGMERFAASLSTPEYRESLRQFINSMFPSPDSEALRDWVYEQAVQTSPHVMRSALESMFDRSELDWDPKRVDFPVLVINAPNPMWTADYQDYVRGLSKQTNHRTIDGVGHFLMLEKPIEFNATLTMMLRDSGLMAK